MEAGIAVFPILADVVKVKKGSGSTAHWSINFIRLSGWLRRCFILLITPLDIDGIGQNWEDSNSMAMTRLYGRRPKLRSIGTGYCKRYAVLFFFGRKHAELL